MLPFAALLDSRQIARFNHEARAAAQLAHPNIVPVFAVGVQQGVHYYAMQLIDGQPLDRVIAQRRQTSGDSPSPTRSARRPGCHRELVDVSLDASWARRAADRRQPSSDDGPSAAASRPAVCDTVTGNRPLVR